MPSATATAMISLRVLSSRSLRVRLAAMTSYLCVAGSVMAARYIVRAGPPCPAPVGTRIVLPIMNHRIRSLSGVSSPEFIGVYAAGQTACAYSNEPDRTLVNCNPDCNSRSRRSLHLWLRPSMVIVPLVSRRSAECPCSDGRLGYSTTKPRSTGRLG